MLYVREVDLLLRAGSSWTGVYHMYGCSFREYALEGACSQEEPTRSMEPGEESSFRFFVLFLFRNIMAENLPLGVMSAGFGRHITTLAMRHLPRLMKLWEKQQVKLTAARHRSAKKKTATRRMRM